ELPPATTYSAYFGRFLSGANLTHFYFYFKLAGIVPYQFSEIYAPIGCIIKSCFSPVALKFYIAYFHFKIECSCNDSGANHGFGFFGAHFVQFFEIALIGLAKYREKHIVLAHPLFFHL